MSEIVHDGWRVRGALLPAIEQVRWQRVTTLAREIRPTLDTRAPATTEMLAALVRSSEAADEETGRASLVELEALVCRLVPGCTDTLRRRAAKLFPQLAPERAEKVAEDLLAVPDPDEPLIVLDTETTGLVAGEHQVIEVYALRVHRDDQDSLHRLVRLEPGAVVDDRALAVNGLSPRSAAFLREAVSLRQVIEELDAWIGHSATIVAHNASFDRRMLVADAARVGLELRRARWFCTKLWAQALQRSGAMPPVGARLTDLCAHFGIVNTDAHRAQGDVEATLAVFEALRDLDEAHERSLIEERSRALSLSAPTEQPKKKRRAA